MIIDEHLYAPTSVYKVLQVLCVCLNIMKPIVNLTSNYCVIDLNRKVQIFRYKIVNHQDHARMHMHSDSTSVILKQKITFLCFISPSVFT